MGTSIQMIITRLHSRAHPSFIPAHNACIFGMETPLRGRSGGHTGNRPYHSKHTSPFRKGENKSFNACIAYANDKT